MYVFVINLYKKWKLQTKKVNLLKTLQKEKKKSCKKFFAFL